MPSIEEQIFGPDWNKTGGSSRREEYEDDDEIESILRMIERAEGTRGDYAIRGESGEYGKYQFMPGTWRDWSTRHFGRELEQTPENQEKVARAQVADLKKQGYSAREILSIWSSGRPEPTAKGVNKYGVAYDTAAYVERGMGGVELGPQPQAEEVEPKPRQQGLSIEAQIFGQDWNKAGGGSGGVGAGGTDPFDRLRTALTTPSRAYAGPTTPPQPTGKSSTIAGTAKAFGRGAAEGLTIGIPGMLGEAVEFVGNKTGVPAIERVGSGVKEWSKKKADEWFGGSMDDLPTVEKLFYEATKMLAPSIIPGGAATTAFRAFRGVGALVKAAKAAQLAGDTAKAAKYLADAKKIAETSVKVGGSSAAVLFGLSGAQRSRDTALARADMLEKQGNIAEAEEMRRTADGYVPYLVGAIEGVGEYFGTKYLGKLLGLDEAEIVGRSIKQIGKDLVKTLGVEVGTEVGQSGGQAAVEKYAGVRPEADILDEMLSVIGPTALMTMMTGGLASGAAALSGRKVGKKEEDVDTEEDAAEPITPWTPKLAQDLMDAVNAIWKPLEVRAVRHTGMTDTILDIEAVGKRALTNDEIQDLVAAIPGRWEEDMVYVGDKGGKKVRIRFDVKEKAGEEAGAESKEPSALEKIIGEGEEEEAVGIDTEAEVPTSTGVVFHGTANWAGEFSGKAGFNTGAPDTELGLMFTSDPLYAADAITFGRNAEATKGHVVAAKVDLKKPFVIKAPEPEGDIVSDLLMKMLPEGFLSKEELPKYKGKSPLIMTEGRYYSVKKAREVLESKGYDGIIVRDWSESQPLGKQPYWIIAFDPNRSVRVVEAREHIPIAARQGTSFTTKEINPFADYEDPNRPAYTPSRVIERPEPTPYMGPTPLEQLRGRITGKPYRHLQRAPYPEDLDKTKPAPPTKAEERKAEDTAFDAWAKMAANRTVSEAEYAQAKKFQERVDEDKAIEDWAKRAANTIYAGEITPAAFERTAEKLRAEPVAKAGKKPVSVKPEKKVKPPVSKKAVAPAPVPTPTPAPKPQPKPEPPPTQALVLEGAPEESAPAPSKQPVGDIREFPTVADYIDAEKARGRKWEELPNFHTRQIRTKDVRVEAGDALETWGELYDYDVIARIVPKDSKVTGTADWYIIKLGKEKTETRAGAKAQTEEQRRQAEEKAQAEKIKVRREAKEKRKAEGKQEQKPKPKPKATTAEDRDRARGAAALAEIIGEEEVGVQKPEETRPLIDKAMNAEYASGIDITNDWNRMSPLERQKAIADGLHVETDRSGRRVIGSISQEKKTQILRNRILAKRQLKPLKPEPKTKAEAPKQEPKPKLSMRDKVLRIVESYTRAAVEKNDPEAVGETIDAVRRTIDWNADINEVKNTLDSLVNEGLLLRGTKLNPNTGWRDVVYAYKFKRGDKLPQPQFEAPEAPAEYGGDTTVPRTDELRPVWEESGEAKSKTVAGAAAAIAKPAPKPTATAPTPTPMPRSTGTWVTDKGIYALEKDGKYTGHVIYRDVKYEGGKEIASKGYHLYYKSKRAPVKSFKTLAEAKSAVKPPVSEKPEPKAKAKVVKGAREPKLGKKRSGHGPLPGTEAKTAEPAPAPAPAPKPSPQPVYKKKEGVYVKAKLSDIEQAEREIAAQQEVDRGIGSPGSPTRIASRPVADAEIAGTVADFAGRDTFPEEKLGQIDAVVRNLAPAARRLLANAERLTGHPISIEYLDNATARRVLNDDAYLDFLKGAWGYMDDTILLGEASPLRVGKVHHEMVHAAWGAIPESKRVEAETKTHELVDALIVRLRKSDVPRSALFAMRDLDNHFEEGKKGKGKMFQALAQDLAQNTSVDALMGYASEVGLVGDVSKMTRQQREDAQLFVIQAYYEARGARDYMSDNEKYIISGDIVAYHAQMSDAFAEEVLGSIPEPLVQLSRAREVTPGFKRWVDGWSRARLWKAEYEGEYTGEQLVYIQNIREQRHQIQMRSLAARARAGVAGRSMQRSITRRPYAEVFYSQVARAAAKLPGSGSANQFRQAFASWVKKGEIKQAELDWLGLDEWLDRKQVGGGKVTKAEVLDFIAQNEVKLVEVERKELTEEESHKESWKGVRYPGHGNLSNKNYREMLLVVPYHYSRTELDAQAYEEFNKPYDELTQGEQKFVMAEVEGGQEHNFLSAHWDEPGVMAHIRMEDVEGGGLFVMEIQSDWHQKGRKYGYYSPKKANEAKVEGQRLKAEYTNYIDSLYKKYDLERKVGDIAEQPGRVMAELRKRATYSEISRMDDLGKEFVKVGSKMPVIGPSVPEAPFAKNWDEVVMKRMLRYAAENGYTHLSWPGSAEVVARIENYPGLQKKGDKWILSGYGEEAEGPNVTSIINRYIQDIPRFLKKYGKKWDAEVESGVVPAAWHPEAREWAILRDGELYDAAIDEEHAQLYVNGLNAGLADVAEIVLDLSEEQTDKALDYLDLGARNKEKETLGAAQARVLADLEDNLDMFMALMSYLELEAPAVYTYEHTVRDYEGADEVQIQRIPITDKMKEAVLYQGQPQWSVARNAQPAPTAPAPAPANMSLMPLDLPELTELIQMLNDGKLDVSVLPSKRMPKSLGTFNSKTGRIHLRQDIFQDDVQARSTFAHEIGHFIDWIVDKAVGIPRGNILGRLASLYKNFFNHYGGIAASNKDLRQELKALTQHIKPFNEADDPAYTRKRYASAELYADAVSVLLNDPGLLQRMAPSFHQAFFDFLHRKPAMEAHYNAFQRLVRDPDALVRHRLERRLGSIDEGKDAIVKHQQKLLKDWKEKLARAKTELFEGLIDQRQIAEEAKKVRVAAGERITYENDPMLALEELAYSDNEQYLFWADMVKQVLDPMRAAGVTERDFQAFLDTMRDIRNQQAKKGLKKAVTEGHTLKSLTGMVKLQRKDMGKEKFQAMAEAQREFVKLWRKYVLPRVERAELVSAETLETMKKNKFYVTFFNRDYVDKLFTDDGMPKALSPMVYRGIGHLKPGLNSLPITMMKGMALMRAADIKMTAMHMVDHMQSAFGEKGARKAKRRGKTEFERPEPGEAMLYVMHQGKIQAYITRKSIVDIFYKNPVEAKMLMRIGSMFQSFVKGLFVRYNPGWITANLVRDTVDTYKKIPGLSLPKLLKHQIKAAPEIWREMVRNELSPDLHEMLEGKMLIVGRTFRHMDMNEDLSHLENMILAYGLSSDQARREQMKWYQDVLDRIDRAGRFTERLNKVATYKFLKDQVANLDQVRDKIRDLEAKQAAGRLGATGKIQLKRYRKRLEMLESPKWIAHAVRHLAGTPDAHRAGKWSWLYNNIWLFSNINKEGWRAHIEAAGNDPRDYWVKTLKFTLLPKVVMFGAAIGFWPGGGGEWWKRFFDNISEHNKAAYNLIPLGMTESGKSAYFRIPADYGGSVMGAMLWKLMAQTYASINKEGYKYDPKGWANVVDYMIQSTPYGSLHPMLGVIADTITMLRGNNPYDSFRGQPVIPEHIFAAGDSRTIETFMKYAWNQMGGRMFFQFEHESIPYMKKELYTKVAENTPVLGPAAWRWVQVSDYGLRQQYSWITDEAGMKEAQAKLDRRERIMDNLRQTIDAGRKPSSSQASRLYRELARDGLVDRKTTSLREFWHMYNRYAARTYDNRAIDAVVFAKNNNAKAELLWHYRHTMEYGDYNRLVSQLRREGHLSSEAMAKARKLERERR